MKILNSTNGKQLLEEFQRNNNLTIKSRRILVSLLYDHLYETFGTSPDKKATEEICIETVNVFTCLKCIPSEINGIVSTLIIFMKILINS